MSGISRQVSVSLLYERGVAKRFKTHAGGWRGGVGGYLSTADWSDVCSCIVIHQRVKQRTGMTCVTTLHFSRWYRQLFIYILTRVERESSITQINGTCLSRKYYCGWHLSRFTAPFLCIMISYAKLPSFILPTWNCNTFRTRDLVRTDSN